MHTYNCTLPWKQCQKYSIAMTEKFYVIRIIYYDYDMDVRQETKHMGIIIPLHMQKYLSIYINQ